jgi:GNAT superfamily N-acetyltransferase
MRWSRQDDLVQIRRLEPGDEATAERACRAFGAEGDLAPETFLARPETVLIVAEERSQVVRWAYGHELVHPDGERTMLLHALDVAEDRWRRGIGRTLVTAFVDHARATGCTEVWVLTDDGNPAAVATYRAAGGQRDPVDQVMVTWMLGRRRYGPIS